jgi:hypothetical protein
MSTLKTNILDTPSGSGNITVNRPTVLTAGDIITADIADNAITLAKMAGGTDGQIITYDASGDPVAVGPGTDGQVLTSTGAGSPPAFEAAAGGGAWNIIGTSVASNSASLTITGLSSTYDTYALVASDIVPVTDGASLDLRVGDSGGVDSGSTDYDFHTTRTNAGSGSYAATVSTGSAGIATLSTTGNAAGEGGGFVAYLHRPGDGSIRPQISGTMTNVDQSSVIEGNHFYGSRKAVIVVDRVQILCSTGNISTGRFSVFGVAHA